MLVTYLYFQSFNTNYTMDRDTATATTAVIHTHDITSPDATTLLPGSQDGEAPQYEVVVDEAVPLDQLGSPTFSANPKPCEERRGSRVHFSEALDVVMNANQRNRLDTQDIVVLRRQSSPAKIQHVPVGTLIHDLYIPTALVFIHLPLQ